MKYVWTFLEMFWTMSCSFQNYFYQNYRRTEIKQCWRHEKSFQVNSFITYINNLVCLLFAESIFCLLKDFCFYIQIVPEFGSVTTIVHLKDFKETPDHMLPVKRAFLLTFYQHIQCEFSIIKY